MGVIRCQRTMRNYRDSRAIRLGKTSFRRTMKQKIEPLTEVDQSRLDEMRVWVRDHYAAEARHRFKSPDGKIVLIETILTKGWIAADET